MSSTDNKKKGGFFNIDSLRVTNSLWLILSKKRKTQFFLLLSLMTFSGILELTLIKDLLPLVNSLINNSSGNNNVIIFGGIQNLIQRSTGLSINILNLLFYSSLVFISTILKLVTLWINERFTASIGNDITYKAFSKSIRLPYELHISKNSSEIIAATIRFSDDTTQYIKSFIRAIYFALLTISISLGLFIVNFKLTFFAILLIILSYLYVSKLTKSILILNGKKIALSYSFQTKLLQEGLGSIRDLIINKNYSFYESSFLKSDITKRKSYADNTFISSSPKPLLEGIGIIVVLSILFILNNDNPSDNGQNIGLIASFCLGCQKLLPSIQTVYMMISKLRSDRESVKNVIKIIKNENKNSINDCNLLEKFNEPLTFKNITLDKIFFKYKASKNWNINSISLKIQKGDKIGIIGATGCGKSTLIDLITGLIQPNKGRIFFNDFDVNFKNENFALEQLHSITSFVPQNIFITDDSIYKNIAYGIKAELIDYQKVIECSKKAILHDLIITKPMGYDSLLGERGINLSGGQIQRLGIARALYRDPKFLILDEATSALDNVTEQKVLNSIFKPNDEVTVIMIAHRLNTLLNCDKVLEIENGCIKNIFSKNDIKLRIKNEVF